ncbi:MAG TPA: ROK family protein [Acidobacteriaceae bacterium]
MKAIGAIDIGGTKIAAGLVDDAGRVLSRRETPTQRAGNWPQACHAIAEMLRECAREANATIAGIGIGSTGPVNPLAGTFENLDTIPQWSGASPVADFAHEFGVSAAIENDADAGALGEAAWGAGKDKSRLIYVTVGTGIGGGMIFEGHLYRGVDGSHPEVAHQVLEAHGPPCSWGLRGCWEALASGPAMALWMESHPEYKHAAGISARHIYEHAEAGDPLAARCVERETFYLGIGLANLVNLFTPDAIILGGSVMKSAGAFLNDIREVMRQGCRFVPLDKVELSLASLGEDANLIGAARVWHHRFAQQP